MRRSPRLIASFLAVTALVSTAVLWKKAPWSHRPAAQADGLAAPPPGRQVTLHVRWHETSTVRLTKAESAGLADTLPGETEIEADLVLSREAMSHGGDAVRAELHDVRTARVVVSGQSLVEPGESGTKSLENQPVHFVIEDGRIARVLVDKNAPSLTVQITENVARQVLLPRAKEGAFDRQEDTPAGLLKLHYEPKGAAWARNVTAAVSAFGLAERCEAPCAVSARGEGEVSFDDEGPVEHIAQKLELRAIAPGAAPMLEQQGSFEAKQVKQAPFAAATLDTKELASKPLGEPFENEAERHAALERRAAGASIEEVLGGLSTIASSGTQGLPSGWLVRSTALLELEPKLVDEVAVRFEDEGIGQAGRIAILDLLASTGSDHAKAALLRVLDSDVARRDDQRLALIQRLMLVESPNAHLAVTLRQRFAESQASGDTEMAYAEAHVLGAMAGRLSAQGMPAEAKASVDTLANALEGARTATARAAYVSALGNAGDPTQVGRVVKHSQDHDPNVRRAVASALRKTKDPAARATLLDLATDSDEDVQVAAVDALTQQASTPTDLARLLDGSQLGGEAEGQVVTTLLRQGPPSTEIRTSLEHVLERTGDPRLAARIRFALEAAQTAN